MHTCSPIMEHNDAGPPLPPKRRPGRPPVYIFTKPDAELSENERRLKGAVLKRRMRQNRSYHRKKRLRQLQAHDEAAAAAAVASTNSFRTPPLLNSSTQRLNNFPITSAPHLHMNNTSSQHQTSISAPHSSIPSLSLPSLPPPSHSQLPRPHNHNASQQQNRPALSSFSLSPSVPRCGDLSRGGSANGVTVNANIMVTANTPNNQQNQGRGLDPLSPISYVSPAQSASSPRDTNVADYTRALQQLLDLSSSTTTVLNSRHQNHCHPPHSQAIHGNSVIPGDGGRVQGEVGSNVGRDNTSHVTNLTAATPLSHNFNMAQ